MRLKEAAGWNQTEADWERLLALQPDGCFGLDHAGDLAATATVIVYGEDLAWIGMVLTSPECRGRGFGRKLMERAMEFSAASGAGYAGLDATEMGVGLYRRFGFEEVCAVERWGRPAGLESAFRGGSAGTYEPDPDLDARAFGADRMKLLESLAVDDAASLNGLGYAMGRPGSKAAYFGPCVTKSAAAAEDLLRRFLSRHPGEAAYWDILPGNREAVLLAEKYGFQPLRRLARMTRVLRPSARPITPDNDLVFAIAGFELG
jgi:GNAT superfamily N-acetyltransferase